MGTDFVLGRRSFIAGAAGLLLPTLVGFEAEAKSRTKPLIVKPDVDYCQSPNFDTRGGATIDSIVLHYTECDLNAAIRRFLTEKEQVSAHYLVGCGCRGTWWTAAWWRRWARTDPGVPWRPLGRGVLDGRQVSGEVLMVETEIKENHLCTGTRASK